MRSDEKHEAGAKGRVGSERCLPTACSEQPGTERPGGQDAPAAVCRGSSSANSQKRHKDPSSRTGTGYLGKNMF